MALIYQSGYVFKDDGTAVEGATVQLYQTDSSTLVTFSDASSTSTTTNSDGYYSASVTEVGATSGYDVKITSGSSIRKRRGNDRLQIEELDIRNDTGATQGGLFVANTTNAVSNKVATFAGMNSSRADNDEIYISFEMNDSGGALDEFARITAIATDVTNDNEDGALVFYVADSDNNGDLQEGFRITSSTGGTVSATTTSASQFNNTITVGVDNTGYDVKFFGATASAYMLWDEDVDDLILAGAARIVVPEGQLVLGSTAISSTSTELNLMDGGSAIGTTAVSDGHGIVMNHGGTMGQTTVQTLAAYLDDEITAMPNLVTVGTIGTGTWNGDAIASAYIAGDAITGAKIADDEIDSEHYADGSIDTAHIGNQQVTAAKMFNLARGSILVGNASAATAELTIGSDNYILTSDGTDIAWEAAAAGGVSEANAVALILALG